MNLDAPDPDLVKSRNYLLENSLTAYINYSNSTPMKVPASFVRKLVNQKAANSLQPKNNFFYGIDKRNKVVRIKSGVKKSNHKADLTN